MPPPPCNKCHSVAQPAGDSWCVGCSALQVSQGFLRKRWGQLGLRALAEESALSSARFVWALYNLDSSLASSSSVAEGRTLLTAAKSKAERPRSRSPRNERPPIRRLPVPPPPPRRDDKEPEEESDFSEEEDSEEEEPVRDAEVKVESKEGRRDWRGSERPPEPLHPPEGKSKKSRRSPASEASSKRPRSLSQKSSPP